MGAEVGDRIQAGEGDLRPACNMVLFVCNGKLTAGAENQQMALAQGCGAW